MKPKILCLLALLACLTGCVPLDSLNPLYQKKDAVFDQALLGTWTSTKDDEETILDFVALNDDSNGPGYTITMSGGKKGDKSSSIGFEAHLVSLGGHKFLDLKPLQWEPRENFYPLRIQQSKNGVTIEPHLLKLGMASYLEFNNGAQLQAHLRPAHWFLRVSTDGKKLSLDYIDDDKFRNAVHQGKFHLANSIFGSNKNEDIVVTASTQELQKFLVEHADDDTLFTDHMDELSRKQ